MGKILNFKPQVSNLILTKPQLGKLLLAIFYLLEY